MQKGIVDLVDSALNAKLENGIEVIKDNIDIQIYEAYGLTKEEIEIIEGTK